MKVKSLKRYGLDGIWLEWDDGHAGPVTLSALRDRCPCAGCSGESVLLHEYVPPPPDAKAPGRYVLASAASVGNYAMQFGWGDGHAQGIYTWDVLRKLCECEICSRKRRGSEDDRSE